MDAGRRRPIVAAVRALMTALVLALVLAGCSSGDATPSKSFAARPTTGLATKLEPPPKFSGPGASSWARDYTPTESQFLDQFYAVKVHDKIRSELKQQGLQEIVHTLWITDDQIQNDIVVLRFATAGGAAERLSFAQSTNDGNGELKSYSIDSVASPVVYYTDRAVNKGFLQAKAYAQYGPYVIEMFTYAPNSIPRTQINRWMTAQVALLR